MCAESYHLAVIEKNKAISPESWRRHKNTKLDLEASAARDVEQCKHLIVKRRISCYLSPEPESVHLSLSEETLISVDRSSRHRFAIRVDPRILDE